MTRAIAATTFADRFQAHLVDGIPMCQIGMEPSLPGKRLIHIGISLSHRIVAEHRFNPSSAAFPGRLGQGRLGQAHIRNKVALDGRLGQAHIRKDYQDFRLFYCNLLG